MLVQGFLFFLFVVLGTAGAEPFPYTPQDISSEARVFLEQATPVGCPVTSEDHWQVLRQGYRQWASAGSNKAKREHVKSFEKKEIAGVPVFEMVPINYIPDNPEKILIYIHGGGFTLGSSEHLAQIYAPVAHKTNLKVIAIEYPLAPEHPYPAAPIACYTVYKHLVDEYGADNILLIGDSAGGSLVLTTLLRAREDQVKMPAGICLLTPWVDVEKHGKYYSILDGRTPILDYEASLLPSLQVYAPDSRDWSNQFISPINADFSGFPPTLIETGSRDLFADNCYRLRNKMENCGVKVQCYTELGMGHDYQDQYDTLEAQRSYERIARFFKGLIRN